MTEVRGRRSEVSRPRTGDRGPRSVDRGPETEDRRSEVRGLVRPRTSAFGLRSSDSVDRERILRPSNHGDPCTLVWPVGQTRGVPLVGCLHGTGDESETSPGT